MHHEDGTSPIVRFDAFTFDGHACELRRGGTRLSVPDQSLEILKALLERPGRLVARDELRHRLWPPDTFVDFESGLNAAVRRLREALHDWADQPRFIETLPRRGYRFIGEVVRPPTSGPERSTEWTAPAPGPVTRRPDSLDLVPGSTPRSQSPPDVPPAREDGRRSPSQERARNATARWQWTAIAVLASAALAGGYLAWLRLAPPTDPSMREEPLTTLIGAEASPTLAPDGEQVAFAWAGPNQDNLDIYIQQVGSGSELRRTEHPAWDFSPVWSPDGRWIAFLRGEVPGRSDVILLPPLGGAERRLGQIHIPEQATVPPYLSWLPDSRALFVMSVETGELRRLTTATLSDGHQQPSVSPDGRTVVF